MGMDIRFLGRGAAFYPAYGNTNAYLSLGEDLIFLDFGESAFAKAVRTLNLGSRQRLVVLLTHLHADHAGSLASLISYSHCVLKKQVLVVHPVDTVVELLRLQGIDTSFYDYIPALPQGYPITAEALEVPHALDMQSFGYVLRMGESRVFYSGDTNCLNEWVREELVHGKFERVYHDVASNESASHCSLRRLAEAVPPAWRGRVYAMHLDSPCEDQFRAMGFSVVEVAPEEENNG